MAKNVKLSDPAELRKFAAQLSHTVEKAIGANVRRVRVETGRSQDQLATRCRSQGLAWTQSTISEIEAGERPLDVGEFVLLALVLGVPPAELLAGDGPVWVAGNLMLDQSQLRDILTTRRQARRGTSLLPDVETEPGVDAGQEAERKAARKLGIPAAEVAEVAARLWGRSLTAERNARLSPDANHAARGHVTRALVAEIEANVKRPAPPAPTRKGKR